MGFLTVLFDLEWVGALYIIRIYAHHPQKNQISPMMGMTDGRLCKLFFLKSFQLCCKEAPTTSKALPIRLLVQVLNVVPYNGSDSNLLLAVPASISKWNSLDQKKAQTTNQKQLRAEQKTQERFPQRRDACTCHPTWHQVVHLPFRPSKRCGSPGPDPHAESCGVKCRFPPDGFQLTMAKRGLKWWHFCTPLKGVVT